MNEHTDDTAYEGRENVLLSSKYRKQAQEAVEKAHAIGGAIADDVVMDGNDTEAEESVPAGASPCTAGGVRADEDDAKTEGDDEMEPEDEERLSPEPGADRVSLMNLSAASGSAQTAAAVAAADQYVGREVQSIQRLAAHQGHGYAAEQANNLADRLHGRNAVIVGNDNALNGPDRMVDGQLIQTKYYADASRSVGAAFKDGQYRYMGPDGKPMQLEVPSDQYEQAVALMEKRIAQGEVPGVTDPAEARNIIRKGQFSYETAQRIAQAGTVESIVFDAAAGIIVGQTMFGIAGAIAFAKALWDGEDFPTAVDMGVCTGLQSGGVGFLSYVCTAQLLRAGAGAVFQTPAEMVVRMLPRGSAQKLVPALRGAGAQSVNRQALSTLLRTQALAAAVTVAVMSAGDIINCFRGRISGKQLFKNITIAAGGALSGLGGALAGGILLGPAGLVIGGMAGGAAGGAATQAAMDELIEDDAVQLVKIIEARLVPLAQEYLLNEDELSIVLDDLQKELVQDKLLEMYAADDREAFADDMLRHIIERVTAFRVRVRMPSAQDMEGSVARVLTRTAEGEPAFTRKEKIDPQDVAQSLLDREVSDSTARKAWYVTKQMHGISKQEEHDLLDMKAGEAAYAARQKELAVEREAAAAEFDKWTGRKGK